MHASDARPVESWPTGVLDHNALCDDQYASPLTPTPCSRAVNPVQVAVHGDCAIAMSLISGHVKSLRKDKVTSHAVFMLRSGFSVGFATDGCIILAGGRDGMRNTLGLVEVRLSCARAPAHGKTCRSTTRSGSRTHNFGFVP